MERAKIALEETRGPKCKKRKSGVNTKVGRRFPSHMAIISGDGTAEGGLGKVVYGVS